MGSHLGVDYKMRMPAELKEKIAESAKSLNRSMNADIVARLQSTFDEDEELANSPLGALFKEYEQDMKNAGSTMTSLSNTILNQSETIKIQAHALEMQRNLIIKLMQQLDLGISIEDLESELKAK